MKLLKKNQFIIYIIVLMLMTAGYLNFTTNQGNNSVETSLQMESKDDTKLADIGDAKLVSSNDVVSEEKIEESQKEDSKEVNNKDSSNQNLDNNVQEKQEAQSADSTNEEIDASAVSVDEYFIKSKLERDTMYSQMISTYENVLNSSNALETQKQSATQEISKINETKNSIMICENLIQTKGFEDSVIFVNKDSISVIIGAKEIKPEEVAQIQNIISREMKANIENIHIATK